MNFSSTKLSTHTTLNNSELVSSAGTFCELSWSGAPMREGGNYSWRCFVVNRDFHT